MTVLITADLHFSDNPRDHYRHQFIENDLLKIIQKKKVQTLLVLGDLTEKKDRHGAWLTNTIAEHFNILGSWVKIIILQGNHDAFDEECPFFYFLTMLHSSGQIRWIGDPTSVDVDRIGKCLFLPYTSDYRSRWDSSMFEDVDWIFAHNTFQGTISESGKELDGIPVDVFPEGVRVIAGDIHKPQKVGPVTYVGSPYLVDFGDDFEPRMLLIKDDKKVVSIPCGGSQKRLIHISDPLSSEMHIEGESNPGDILKVRVPVTKESYAKWDEIQRRIREWGKSHDVDIHTIQPVVESDQYVSKDQNRTTKNSNESDKSLVRRYADLQGYGSKVVRVGYQFVE